MTGGKLATITALAALVIGLIIGADWSRTESTTRSLWKQAVAPGALSLSHAELSDNCAACHRPLKGVESRLCIACHSNNATLMQRQPTAFHTSVQTCTGCHIEHRGESRMPTKMDHSLFAQVAHQDLNVEAAARPRNASTPSAERKEEECEGVSGCAEGSSRPTQGTTAVPIPHPGVGAKESMLDCVRCHATKDRHQGLFGADCVQCHTTSQWTVPTARHPSPRSTNCSQCHQPPPSHSMMHFSMMSVPLAGKRSAEVNQCFLCHQTTAWNDIKGVGRLKHH